MIGGQSPAGIERAARLGDGLITLSNDHCEVYLDGLRKSGKDVNDGQIYASQWSVVAEDPERTWASIGDHVLYQFNKYIEWAGFEGPNQRSVFPSPQSLIDAGVYHLMDASVVVTELTDLATRYPQIRDSTIGRSIPASPSSRARSAFSTWLTTSSRLSQRNSVGEGRSSRAMWSACQLEL